MMNKKKLRICILLCTVVFLFSFMNIILGQDEDFTMSLIRHNYEDIIYLDSLDVHPPLYYIVLKFFLGCTTFWTNSIFVKIIFSRILSLIFSCITFLYLSKILKLTGYKVSIYIQYISFFLVPSVMLYSTQIRMYSLTAMFISMEFYELLKFSYTSQISYKNWDPIFIIIFAEGAAYSHYFGVISAGLFLIIFTARYIKLRNIKHIIVSLILDVLFILLYLPWISTVIKQFKMASTTTLNNVNGLNKIMDLMKELFFSFVGEFYLPNHILSIIYIFPLLILFILSCVYSFKSSRDLNTISKNIFFYVFINFILTIIFGEVFSFLMHPFYSHRYVYPLFDIIAFLIINLLILNRHKFKGIYIIIGLLIFISITGFSMSLSNCVKSTSVINKVHMYRMDPSKKIFIHLTNKDNGNATHMSVYLYSMKKHIVVKNINSKNSFGRSEPKLFKKIYPNIKSNNIY